ncbi:lanthionine synthetase C family protein [Verrucosispora sioxanthis]|nr:lanthionine synthetase C family protein [Verrucosispora sioxanthis]
MPYLGQGSVGIGLVLDQYLRHRDDEQFAEASAGVRRAARSPFYAQSGLFAGRAGIIAYLAAHRDDPQLRQEMESQVRRLGWHALPYRDGTAFPGEQLLRLSMDLATGTAGVLLALATARRDAPTPLPFLAPLTGAPDSPATAGATLTPTTDGR